VPHNSEVTEISDDNDEDIEISDDDNKDSDGYAHCCIHQICCSQKAAASNSAFQRARRSQSEP
jgi:hypothetical protein